MKKFSELVKKASIALNDYVPIIDSAATSDVDKNKTTRFSTILNYFKQDMIANSQTVTEPGLKALDAVQANPNVSGTFAAQVNDSIAVLNGYFDGSIQTPVNWGLPLKAYSASALEEGGNFYMRNTSNTATDTLSTAFGNAGSVKLWICFSTATDPNSQVQVAYAYNTGSIQYMAVRAKAWWGDKVWAPWKIFTTATKTLGGLVAIPQNADLNTYTTPGEYYVGTNTIAATIVNRPLAVAGRLTVEHGVSYNDATIYLRQTYTPHSSAIFNQFTYVRTSSNTGSTWSAWSMMGAQIYSSQNTATVSVPSGTWTEIYRASNVPAGIYEITFSGLFGTASAGMRSIQFANAAVGGTPSWSTGFGRRTQTQLPVTNGNTILTLTRVLRTTEVQDIVFAIYHTAGANISCNAGVDILRLA